ncbi:MAG: diguanylate cyclase, partial [Gammaproteobacteria bacterium]
LILFEPGRFPGRALFGPLVYRRDPGYGWFDVATIDYPNNAGWYLQMRTESRELWGAPYRMHDSANWVSTFATPMMLGPELVGAVGLDVKLKALLRVIGVDESEEPLFTVLDRGGQFVYHHRDDLSTVNVEDQTDDDLGHIQALRRARSAWREGARGSDVAVQSYVEGDLWSFAAPVPASGWQVIVQVPAAQALAAAREQGRRSLGFIGLIIVAVALAAISIARWISRPIDRLRKAAASLAAGDFNVELPARSSDEVGELAHSFDYMVEQLAERDTAVRARTVELGERVRELNCLFGFAELLGRHDLELPVQLEQAVELIPTGFNRPDDTCARIEYRGRVYSSKGFVAGSATFSTTPMAGGHIEVHRSASDGGESAAAFDEQEQALANQLGAIVSFALERQQASDGLALYKRIADQSGDGVAVMDAQGQVVYWNRAASGLLNVGEADVLGRQPNTVIAVAPDDAVGRGIEFLQPGTAAQPAAAQDFKCVGPDGSERWVEVLVTAMTVEGEPWSFAFMRDAQERKLRELNLKSLAETDPLTGLANRRTFQARLELSMDSRAYLAMADIDHFKKVNDTYGHDVGDDVIRFLGKTLTAAFPDAICVARLGGEEFGVLFRSDNDAQAIERVERCRIDIASHVAEAKHSIKVTASLGLSSTGVTGPNAGKLLKSADEALYASKRGGRNRVTLANGGSPEMAAASAV